MLTLISICISTTLEWPPYRVMWGIGSHRRIEPANLSYRAHRRWRGQQPEPPLDDVHTERGGVHAVQEQSPGMVSCASHVLCFPCIVLLTTLLWVILSDTLQFCKETFHRKHCWSSFVGPTRRPFMFVVISFTSNWSYILRILDCWACCYC